MLANIVQFLNLFAFGFVVSQPLFYLLAFSRVQRELPAATYVELRKSLDRNLQLSLRFAYYGALATGSTLLLFSLHDLSGLRFITSLVSFLCLLADMYFMLKGNQPINKLMNTWTVDSFPEDWRTYRARWFFQFQRRQIADVIGFLSLLLGAVFT